MKRCAFLRRTFYTWIILRITAHTIRLIIYRMVSHFVKGFFLIFSPQNMFSIKIRSNNGDVAKRNIFA